MPVTVHSVVPQRNLLPTLSPANCLLAPRPTIDFERAGREIAAFDDAEILAQLARLRADAAQRHVCRGACARNGTSTTTYSSGDAIGPSSSRLMIRSRQR